jgi:galactose mutarotase-like enzyme
MPQHGFARRRHFPLIEHSEKRTAFWLDADTKALAIYPFAFSLEMSFSIEGKQLNVAARVANERNRAMPFSFGFHPAFAWPLPYGTHTGNHRILFDEREPAPLRDIDPQSGLIAATSRRSPVEDRQLIPTYAMFERDALI